MNVLLPNLIAVSSHILHLLLKSFFDSKSGLRPVFPHFYGAPKHVAFPVKTYLHLLQTIKYTRLILIWKEQDHCTFF